MTTKHTEADEEEVIAFTARMAGEFHEEFMHKRFGRWHYMLIVCPEYDEGDAVYQTASSFPRRSMATILRAVANMIDRNYMMLHHGRSQS